MTSAYSLPDHPRRCGENLYCLRQAGRAWGSPPQVRGKHRSNAQKAVKYRITPAGAGKTMLYIIAQILYKDHPRRCGENKSHGRERSAREGTPPQVRGKLWATAPVAACMRITPAGAGKTSATSFAIRGTWDHPRRCGENVLSLQFPKPPPWITPADAGKTMSSSSAAAKRWDHPRGCGENAACIGWYFVVSGSPPRMRGKQVRLDDIFEKIRITPADAGKTRQGSGEKAPGQDHPRGCGENHF